MLKSMRINKIVLCIATILLMVCLMGNTNVFADGNSVTITAATTTNEATNNTTNGNSIINSLTATTNSSNYNNTTNNTVNNTTNKTTNKTNLPYTGSKSVSAFVVIILIGSAVYAYKKVSDYNM